MTSIQFMSLALFILAILHTFSTKIFEHMARVSVGHKGLWHLLGEVEVVFGFWAMVLIAMMFFVVGKNPTLSYLNGLSFAEPEFVFTIMVIAGSKPILHAAENGLSLISKWMPFPGRIGLYFTLLAMVPLLGSLITEPAAMTLGALMLRDYFLKRDHSKKFRYISLGVLFVNVSIGGVLTAFAAPPVVMIAEKWGWSSLFMFTTFGWKAMVAVMVNAFIAVALLYKELATIPLAPTQDHKRTIPIMLTLAHVACLVGVVIFSHQPTLFMSVFLLFMGIAHAYSHYQNRLILREGLLVAFFLAGLVVLGGQQIWWIQPLLMNMKSDVVFFGATALTAITDNAALTYLASLVTGISDHFKYALVAGAVTGGGLTILANAPNPAGISILRDHFEDKTVNPFWLLLAALFPTCVAALAFLLL